MCVCVCVCVWVVMDVVTIAIKRVSSEMDREITSWVPHSNHTVRYIIKRWILTQTV